MTVTVSLVEDSQSVRGSLVELLNATPGLRCLGSYGSAEEALQKIPASPPDVVLMDINLPGMSGVECVGRLKRQLPRLRVLMLSNFEQSDIIFESICAGASGYLLKHTRGCDLVETIEQVHAGGSPMSISVARKLMEYFQQVRNCKSELEKLTPGENETLKLLANGHLCGEIAGRLRLSAPTVQEHLHGIYRKLHVRSSGAASLDGDQSQGLKNRI